MKREPPPPPPPVVFDQKAAAHLVRAVDNALMHLRIIRLALSDIVRRGIQVNDLPVRGLTRQAEPETNENDP